RGTDRSARSARRPGTSWRAGTRCACSSSTRPPSAWWTSPTPAHGAPVPTTAGCGARTGTTACPATMAWPLSGSTTWARPSCTIPAPCPPSVSQSPGGFSAKGRVGEQSRPPDRSLSVITPLIGVQRHAITGHCCPERRGYVPTGPSAAAAGAKARNPGRSAPSPRDGQMIPTVTVAHGLIEEEHESSGGMMKRTWLALAAGLALVLTSAGTASATERLPAGDAPPGFWWGTDSFNVSVPGKAPYSMPFLGGAYGGYIGMTGNWAYWQGCSGQEHFIAYSSANAAQAHTNFVT